jgi:Ca-activated chloride channel homolog
MMKRSALPALMVLALVVSGCTASVDSEPIPFEEAQDNLSKLVDDIGWTENPVTRAATVEFNDVELSDTLPPITEFPIVVEASGGGVSVEIFTSTEKSGSGTDGWMVEVAEEFNRSGAVLNDGRSAQVEIRKIPSGTAYEFIAAGRDLPDAISPSNQLWIEMAATHQTMTEVSSSLVNNVAGIVMKSATADELRAAYGTLDAAALIEAVIAGDVVMGYTDPFASSTGLNFLLTVLDEFAEGDESRLVADDVASVFEQFQQRVPFVALTTIQMRESVERESGTLDAFVMEWQTYTQTESLRSGFEFIPFGVRHDNPLYAVGTPSPDKLDVLQQFADFARGARGQDLAREYGFDPPEYTSEVAVPSGATLIRAQRLWKEKKEGGRPVAAVFVTDVSGSMIGTRIQSVQRALLSAREFIKPDASVGMVEFNDQVSLRLPIKPFDLNQQARFVAAIEDMEAAGGTAMYDGVLLGLSMLLEQRAVDPETRLLLIVLTDGETMDGFDFGDVSETIQGLRIPVYTVGFEANVDELSRLSSLVEAASINANEEDVEFKMSALFNAGV